jgi:predicted ATP-grasp superfamily ATP-dependent carboligase
LERGGIPCPRVQLNPPADSDAEGWLVKPYAGAGGAGIQFCEPGQRRPARLLQVYFQEFIAGDTCAAIYVGEAGQALLLGVTGQRVGADWLHAAPFHYCGSIGPLSPAPALGEALRRLGNALASTFGLRGLFGVDCVLRDGVPYPVEVNPRYTASVEVLEYATGLSTLALHCAVFDPSAPPPSLALRASGENNTMVGKAILFARESLTFPADGPWLATLRQPPDIWEMPAFADIPHPGEPIPVGRPVITFFARGDSPTACRDTLQQIAADLDRWLFGA